MFNFFLFILILNFFILIFYKSISKIYNLFDYPDNKRKIHKLPTPLLGGFFLVMNLLIILIYRNFFDNSHNVDVFGKLITYNYFFLITFLFYIVGFYDDKYKISHNTKFILTILLVLLSIYLDPDILLKKLIFSFSDSQVNFGLLSYFVTILCFLLFINAFNMLDGINGQAASYALFIFLLLLIKSNLVIFSVTIIIALLFFLTLNLYNKIFLGDSGTLPFGFMISYIFIKLYNYNKTFLSDEVFLIMSIPGYELIRLAIQRILKRKHPFLPDKNHIHHLIINKYNYYAAFLIVQFTLIFPYMIYILFQKFSVAFVISLTLYAFIIYIFTPGRKSKIV